MKYIEVHEGSLILLTSHSQYGNPGGGRLRDLVDPGFAVYCATYILMLKLLHAALLQAGAGSLDPLRLRWPAVSISVTVEHGGGGVVVSIRMRRWCWW